MRATTRRRALVGIALATTLVVAACGNASEQKSANSPATPSGSTVAAESFPAVSAPGVSPTEIKVGGVASVTNPVGGSYGGAFDGARAYFDMVNASGGVFGRKLVLSQTKDDNAVNNKAAVADLVNADIFAVLPVATLLFSGADDLAASGVPTFGWNINPEWAGNASDPKENLFGQVGSYIGIGDQVDARNQISLPYLAKRLDKHRIGVLTYSVPQSAQCADSIEAAMEKWGKQSSAKVVYLDTGLSYGVRDLSVEAGKMKAAKVDLVASCLDTNGVVTLATALDKAGVDATQLLLNGYDHDFVEQYGDLFEGSIVRTDFAPFELAPSEQPKGLRDYLHWTEKAGVEPTENGVSGWMNAALFVDGLKAAGPQFDRAKLISAINAMTDWTGEGITSPIDWTVRHAAFDDSGVTCGSFVTIHDGGFDANFAKPGKPFTCIKNTGSDALTAVNHA